MSVYDRPPVHEQVHFQQHTKHESEPFIEGLTKLSPSDATKRSKRAMAVFCEAREWIEKRQGKNAVVSSRWVSWEPCGDAGLLNVYYGEATE